MHTEAKSLTQEAREAADMPVSAENIAYWRDLLRRLADALDPKPHLEAARQLSPCTCWGPAGPPADNSGPLKDGSHYANCPSENTEDIALALAAAVAAERAVLEKILKDAALFLRVGAACAPNDAVSDQNRATGEWLKTRGLKDTMLDLAKQLETIRARGGA